MPSKWVGRLAVVFLTVTALAVALHLSNKPQGGDQPYRSLENASVESVILHQRGDQRLTFRKEADGWKLKAPLETNADESNLERLISSLKDLEVQEIISENPDKHSYYQVEDSSPTRVQVFQKGASAPVVDLFIGKPAGDYSHSYLRFPGQNAVHLAQGITGSQVNQSLFYWRDRAVISVNREEVSLIDIEEGKKRYQLLKSSAQWTSQGRAVPPAVMTPMLNLMTPLEADDFAQSTETFKTAGLEPPLFSYALTAGSDTVKVSFGKTLNKKTFAKREGYPIIFLLHDYKVTQILDKVRELK